MIVKMKPTLTPALKVGRGCPQPAASLPDASCRQRRVEDNAALPSGQEPF
jgi:hypothetical protein